MVGVSGAVRFRISSDGASYMEVAFQGAVGVPGGSVIVKVTAVGKALVRDLSVHCACLCAV